MYACVLLFSSPSCICSATTSTHGVIPFTIDGSLTSTNILKIILHRCAQRSIVQVTLDSQDDDLEQTSPYIQVTVENLKNDK